MSPPKLTADVLGAKMAYRESGTGRPIVFLHGNPTSSYLWRDVIGEVDHLGRCIAPDLIGMGDSEKVDSLYRFADHRRYLDTFLEAVGIEDGAGAVLVGHDWGGALMFDWVRRHPAAVAGIVYMETIVTPMSWDDWPEASQRAFRKMRSDEGEQMVLGQNFFVERILPASVLGPLSDETMSEYRRPYPSPGSRLPTLRWPREIPLDGTPEDVAEIVAASEAFMARTDTPKLFVNADPGAILIGRQREACRAWPNQTEVTVPGIHFVQEDSGPAIGRAIAEFVAAL